MCWKKRGISQTQTGVLKRIAPKEFVLIFSTLRRKKPWTKVSLLFQQTGVYPYPLSAGSARPNPKRGSPETENPLCIGFAVLRGGLWPWSQTMVSEGARPWGGGRSKFVNCFQSYVSQPFGHCFALPRDADIHSQPPSLRFFDSRSENASPSRTTQLPWQAVPP